MSQNQPVYLSQKTNFFFHESSSLPAHKNTKQIDMLKFRQKINLEMASIPLITLSNCISSPQSFSNQYSDLYKTYIGEDFTPITMVFIYRLINESKTLPLNIKNSENIQKILIKIVKELLMNEYEIVLLSLLLDICGWVNDNFSLEENLFFSALLVKRKTSGNNAEVLVKYFNEVRDNFENKKIQWENFNHNICEGDKFQFSQIDVNQRYSLLKKPFNIYCQNNFIDFNSVVDKILRMSLPYNDNKGKEEDEDINVTEEADDDDCIVDGSKQTNITNISGKLKGKNENNKINKKEPTTSNKKNSSRKKSIDKSNHKKGREIEFGVIKVGENEKHDNTNNNNSNNQHNYLSKKRNAQNTNITSETNLNEQKQPIQQNSFNLLSNIQQQNPNQNAAPIYNMNQPAQLIEQSQYPRFPSNPNLMQYPPFQNNNLISTQNISTSDCKYTIIHIILCHRQSTYEIFLLPTSNSINAINKSINKYFPKSYSTSIVP